MIQVASWVEWGNRDIKINRKEGLHESYLPSPPHEVDKLTRITRFLVEEWKQKPDKNLHIKDYLKLVNYRCTVSSPITV